MKKILLPLIVLSFPSLLQAATAATQLEGGFKVGPAIILITILILFVMVGVVFRAKDTTDFYAAGRGISKVGSGMAIASNWMSAASFLGMAAIMYGSGYHGLSYVVGWTGGYVLLLILMAGQIRRYGKYTAADFIGDRYYSQGLRGVGAGLAIFISFSYCVGQFAGIGLTHSFAMELMPDRIKVNAICPGNYFEGPLWSDPEKGLFLQYLRAGKVPGAKTIEDVKRHYESMVPAGRGCRVEDLVKAIKYVIDQEYETGQAIPVTGGQVMLS